jgi:hypothetical protein
MLMFGLLLGIFMYCNYKVWAVLFYSFCTIIPGKDVNYKNAARDAFSYGCLAAFCLFLLFSGY